MQLVSTAETAQRLDFDTQALRFLIVERLPALRLTLNMAENGAVGMEEDAAPTFELPEVRDATHQQ